MYEIAGFGRDAGNSIRNGSGTIEGSGVGIEEGLR